MVPDLVRLLDHQDFRVRKEAILALGQLRAPESIPFLGKILFRESLLQFAREESLRIEGAESACDVSLGQAPASLPSDIMAGATEVLKDVLGSIVNERKRSRVEEGRDIVSSIMKGLRQEGQLIERMKRHPVAGAKLLRKIDCGTVLPMIVAFEHHIKYDRTGYPKVRTREPLHVASHMTQIADVYDALRSHRPYRESMELEKTLSIMREGRGTEFEPRLFDGFVEMLS